mmetsp:Transcript_73255/g.127139  ORF Transcript_73255/g.127139 Transcript_73255/m.127139 type:complete len:193 (-) Transcript_73255:141-719(-)
MSNTTAGSEMKCSRCNRPGHVAKECQVLPFLCTNSVADRRAEAAKRRADWQARQAERAKKAAEWEANKADREAKQAQWELRQAAFHERQVARKMKENDCDVASVSTETSTVAASMVCTVDEAEVERMVTMDKVVRKFAKMLRDISKLEGRQDLDELQKAKLARKPDVEMELDQARCLARIRAREELKSKADA